MESSQPITSNTPTATTTKRQVSVSIIDSLINDAMKAEILTQTNKIATMEAPLLPLDGCTSVTIDGLLSRRSFIQDELNQLARYLGSSRFTNVKSEEAIVDSLADPFMVIVEKLQREVDLE